MRFGHSTLPVHADGRPQAENKIWENGEVSLNLYIFDLEQQRVMRMQIG